MPVNDVDWPLHSKHPAFGEVVMVGTFHDEPYRWFENEYGAKSMIPLDALEPYDEKKHG